jgi:hypothetical protein
MQQFPSQIDNQPNMSNNNDSPMLHQPSVVRHGHQQWSTNDGASYVFEAFEIEEIEDSGASTAGSGGHFDPPCCQPSDESVTQASGCSIKSFEFSSDSSNSGKDDQKPAARRTLDFPDYPALASNLGEGCEEEKVLVDRWERANRMLVACGEKPVFSPRYSNSPYSSTNKKQQVEKNNSDTDSTTLDTSISSESSTINEEAH